MKTIDARGAGMGDVMVGLWIAEGARSAGEEICFVRCGRAELVVAFGHRVVDAPSEECMRLGTGGKPYDEELATAHLDDLPRTIRWQRSVGWAFEPVRPRISLSRSLIDWASTQLAENRSHSGEGSRSSAVVIAPRANEGSRTAPPDKWLRVAWQLEREGIRNVAIDANRDAVSAFPFYWFGLNWLQVAALVQGCAVVAGNDSGIAHLAATMGKSTVVAMGACKPEIVFGHCMENVTPLVGEASCAGCHFSAVRGFQAACDHGCEALDMIPWAQIYGAIASWLPVRV